MNDSQPKNRPLASWPMACLRAVLLQLGITAGAASQAQPAADSREAFRVCDSKAFLAMNIARNYKMTGRNRQAVLPHLQGDAAAQAMADDVFARIDAGEIKHPGQLAADTLFQCAAERGMTVGAPRQRVALCYTRTDVAFFMHVERSAGVVRQQAVSKVQARLKSRELYPTALINEVAEAVYAPPQLPDVRQLMGTVAWTCIRQPPSAASAASAASR
jgi:hypothetical protein